MKTVRFSTIPAQKQRYETCGDYWETEETLVFHVSEMADWRAEAAIFLHEFVEAMLCKQQGINFEQIDMFDTEIFKGEGEPGDDPACPYRQQHRTAENLERLFVEALDLHWDEYVKIVEASV